MNDGLYRVTVVEDSRPTGYFLKIIRASHGMLDEVIVIHSVLGQMGVMQQYERCSHQKK